MGTRSVDWCARAAACLCLALSYQAFALEIDSIGGEEAPILTGSATGAARSGGRLTDTADPVELAESLSRARAFELAGAEGWPAESLRDPVDRQPFSPTMPAIPGAIIARSDLGLACEGALAGTERMIPIASGSRGTTQVLGTAAIGLGVLTLLGGAFFAIVWRRS